MMTETMLSYQEGESGDWVSIPKLSSTIPFGYEVNPEDPSELLPVPVELYALEKAKKERYVDRFGYRATAEWLTASTGRRISHAGLKKRLQYERRARNRQRGFSTGAKKLRQALEKIERFEEKQKRRLGAKDRGSEA